MKLVLDMAIGEEVEKIVYLKNGERYVVDSEKEINGCKHYALKNGFNSIRASDCIEFPKFRYIGNDSRLVNGKEYIVISEKLSLQKYAIARYTLEGIKGEFNSLDFVSCIVK